MSVKKQINQQQPAARLRRLMCGRPTAFRRTHFSCLFAEAEPGQRDKIKGDPAGKAKPFRTSGGQAAE